MKKDIIDSGFILYKPQENDVLVLLKENLMSLTINGQEMLCCRAEILRNEKSSFQLVLFSQFMPKRIETENETITNTTFMKKYFEHKNFPFGRMIFVSNEKVGLQKVQNEENCYYKKSIFDYHLGGE